MMLFSIRFRFIITSYGRGETLKLREIRKQRGLSQGQLSELSHVHRISISRYETGKKKPNVDSLKRLAKALDVSTDELLGESA